MIRVVLADDHMLMREGLRRVLQTHPDFEVLGEAATGNEVLQWVRQGGFDVLLLDLSMPEHSGVDFIGYLKKLAPKLPILVLTMHEEEQYAVRCIRAGAARYLTKDSAATELVGALRRVASGRLYISPVVAEQLVLDAIPNTEAPHKLLSDREFEVFQLTVHGKSPTEIAGQLHLSVKTVSTHKARILQKMNMHSVAELVRYAVAHHLMDTAP
jgi:DNA-binding NarL/FixJ family response regulator